MAAIIACMFVLCSCSDKKDADTTDETKVDVAEYYSMVDERIDKIKKVV